MSAAQRKQPDEFSAANAARRAEAIADLVLSGQVEPGSGARRIAAEYHAFMRALANDSPGGPEEAASITFALGVGLDAALARLAKRGPVLVRYIDGDALVTMLMPDGPPKGMGG
ncbi:MAG TPA: hypothetical protein VMW52_02315 [Phycisphaerae bacterium]|nr:hypothetical protein [Phycisphaerae bacterium]